MEYVRALVSPNFVCNTHGVLLPAVGSCYINFPTDKSMVPAGVPVNDSNIAQVLNLCMYHTDTKYVRVGISTELDVQVCCN